MTLLSSKTFPQTGFIFPQLQLQAPKGILPFASGSKETQGKKKKHTHVQAYPVVKRNLPSYTRTGPRRPELSPTLAIRTPGVPDLGQVTGDFSLGGLSWQAAGCGQPSRRQVEPGPRACCLPSRPHCFARQPSAHHRPAAAAAAVSESAGAPSARSLGSLGPSGKAGGDAGLHSPSFEPTLTEVPETGRSRKNGQTRRLKRKTRAAGCKSSPASLANPTPRAAPAAERAPVPGHPGCSGPD